MTDRAIARLNAMIDEARAARDQRRLERNEIGAGCIEQMRQQLIARRDRLELRADRDADRA